ncbi:hypothetical protein TKK_0011762 [Trichogramma kaykai]
MEEIVDLMKFSYPTLRKLINEMDRNMQRIISDWPCLNFVDVIVDHCNILLEKNLKAVWLESLEKKCKVIRRYFKYNQQFKNESYPAIFEQCKSFEVLRKDQVPKLLVTFELLLKYFSEDCSHLWKFKNDDDDGGNVTQYPVIIIKGEAIYSDNCNINVQIGEHINISCKDVLEGIFVNFLCYYLYGYAYARFFFKINPTVVKPVPKKQKATSYDRTVFKLAKVLSEFSDDFHF